VGWALLGAAAGTALTVLLTVDQTRVAVILLWPPLLTVLLAAERAGAAPPWRRLALAAFLLGCLIPRLALWEGRLYGSTGFFTVLLAGQALGAWRAIDTTAPGWRDLPFR
jgi:hypothetical protein